MSDEVETMMYEERQLPWHRKGTSVVGQQTAADAIKAAGMDWDVELHDLWASNLEGEQSPGISMPNTYGVIRQSDGTPLGVVGQRYTPIQNVELFDFFDNVVDSGEAKYETAGSLRGGRIVFMLASLTRDLSINGDDHIPYLLLTSSHDGTMAVKMIPTPVRVVCMNTLRWAMDTAQASWSVRHTQSAPLKVQAAREALGITFAYYDEFEAEAKALLDVKLPEAFDRDKFLLDLIPTGKTERSETFAANKRWGIDTFYTGSPTIGEIRGTGYGLVNAVNEWELWWQKPNRTAESAANAMLRDTATPLTRRAKSLVLR